MGKFIKIKEGDPAYDRAFKHGAAFALAVFGIVMLMCHDGVNAASAFGGALVMGLV